MPPLEMSAAYPRPKLAILVSAASWLLVGCVPFPGGQGVVQVDTLPSGTIAVQNLQTLDIGRTDCLDATEELRIGSVDAQDGRGTQFSSIAAVGVMADGDILAFDRMAREIRVYSPDGTLSHIIGRRGGGPGEFEWPDGLLIGDGGLIFVPDRMNVRISVFDSDGRLRAEYPRELSGEAAFPWPGNLHPDGGLVDWKIHRGFRPGLKYPSSVTYRPVLFSPDFRSQEEFPPIVWEVVSGTSGFPVPFLPLPILHLDRQGVLWLARGDEYRVVKRSLSGDTILTFSSLAAPQKVSALERDTMAATWIPGRSIDPDEVPDEKPVLLQITTGDDRVLVFPRLQGFRDGEVVDIYSRTGFFQHRVALPSPLVLENRVPVFSGGKLYGVVKDELDVEYLVRFAWPIAGSTR